MNSKASLLLAFVLAGCAGDGDLDLSQRDPRCIAACPETMPRYEMAGRICDAPSRALCLDECEARIATVSTVCQSCLVEDSCFEPSCGDSSGVGVNCTNNTCTISSQFGTCTFNSSDEAQTRLCYQQVDPRREVACAVEWRPTTECESVCP